MDMKLESTLLSMSFTIVNKYILRGILIFLLGELCVTLVSGHAWAENNLSDNNQKVQKKTYKEERLAVLDFGGRVDSWIKENLTDKFEIQIARLERFKIISRRDIKEVQKELKLSLTGAIDESKALKAGHMLAAQKLIAGRIQDYDVEWDSDSEVYTTEMTINVKILGVEQGVLLTGFDIKASSSYKDKKTSITETIDEAVSKLILKIRKIYSLEAQIFNVKDGESLINIGQTDGIKKGMLFEVYRLAEEVVNPYTGEVLGQEEEYVGLIEAQSVRPKFSKIKILKGRSKIDVGNKIKEAAGLSLPNLGLLFRYSVSPVSSQKNTALATEDITQAQCYALGVTYAIFDSVIVGGQFGELRMGPISSEGFVTDIFVKSRMTLIPELLDGYIGGSFGYSNSGVSQDLPNADNVFSQLNINSDDNRVINKVSSYSGFLGLRLKTLNLVKARSRLINVFQPFVEISYQHWNPLNEWTVNYKTGEKNKEGKEITRKFRIPEQYLPYPSVDINDFALRFGVVLISWPFDLSRFYTLK